VKKKENKLVRRFKLNIKKSNHYSLLLKQTKSESEKEGVEKLFSMILSLRQQILLRSKLTKENKNDST